MRSTRSAWMAALVVTALVGGAARAADPPGRGSAPPPGSLPPRGAFAAPPAAQTGQGPSGPVGQGKALLPKVSVDQIAQKYAAFSGPAKSQEAMAKAVPDIVKQCSAKAYTVQDQAAAGCTAGDTVKQCSDKLQKHCVATFSNVATLPGLGVGTQGLGTNNKAVTIGFSMQQYQQNTQTAAAEARALSQLLGLYASQIEQEAKAHLP